MKKRTARLSERTRLLLTLGLIVLPAAGLIAFSIFHLKSIQRDRAIEAAIERDFYHMLAISEKRMNARADEMVEDIRRDFPAADKLNTAALDAVLARHPNAAHVFAFTAPHSTIIRSQPEKSKDSDFRMEAEKITSGVFSWLPLESEGIYAKLLKMQSKGDSPFYCFDNWVPRGEKHAYQLMCLLPLTGSSREHIALGGVAFDAEFLKAQFLPGVLNTLMEEENASDPDSRTRCAMVLHPRKESEAVAQSVGWDGGTPEVERNLESIFSGLTLGIKFQGITVEAIGQRFLRTSYLILTGISLLLAVGIFFFYRSVSKEMELAMLKSDFVSNVSHELRTPLSLIRLYAETLELGRVPLPEKQHDYYCIIRKESERLTALINNILDFSRIEAGRKEYDFRQTSLPELVRNTLESYRYQIEQQGFTFEEHIADDVPPVAVDREAIARSLLNLVNNALKYSSKEKFLSVNLYRANGSVKLEVIDRGIGIPRSEQHKVFEKFYRVGDPLVHNTKGSGLGLSLVRHIVHAHGGEVALESNPGQGSKFTIVLPVQATGQPAHAAAS